MAALAFQNGGKNLPHHQEQALNQAYSTLLERYINNRKVIDLQNKKINGANLTDEENKLLEDAIENAFVFAKG